MIFLTFLTISKWILYIETTTNIFVKGSFINYFIVYKQWNRMESENNYSQIKERIKSEIESKKSSLSTVGSV